MTQRAMAVTELRTLSGLHTQDTVAAQCQPSRVRKDNAHISVLSEKIDEFCNPFCCDESTSLLNLATGRAASKTTASYLLNILKRGADARLKFQAEWAQNSSRFLERVKRSPVQNFASENTRKKSEITTTKGSKRKLRA